MRKKLREEAGLTLVEMLAAMAILILLVLMMGTGLQMAVDTYQTVIAKNEVELLLSTTVDALADDLRYARNVREVKTDQYTNFTYTSDSFGDKTALSIEGTDGYAGQIIATGVITNVDGSTKPNTSRVLPTGAYGRGAVMSYKEYRISPVDKDAKIVTYEEVSGEIYFTIKLTVSTSDGKISASTPGDGVTVRCLNPPKAMADTTE